MSDELQVPVIAEVESGTPPCPHLSWTGDEGPIAELGRMPRRWKCDGCGLIRLDGPENAGDDWVNYDAQYAHFTTPYRGGVLSEERRRDPRISRARLLRDGDAIRWMLHWAVRDLVSARNWGRAEATEAQRLRDRLTEVFSLLTAEQREEMRRRDDTRRVPRS